MKKILKLNEFPVLLTLLIGMLGYQLNDIAKSMLNSPTIEYVFKTIKSKPDGKYSIDSNICTLTNISNTKAFRELTINLKFPSSSNNKIFDPELNVISPSSLHHKEAIPDVDSTFVTYELPRIQPGFQYEFFFKTKVPKAEAGVMPKVYLSTTDTIRIVERSFKTIIVANYLLISSLLVLFWTLLILGYIYYLLKK